MLDLCARLIRQALLLRELFTVPIDDNESGIDHIMCISWLATQGPPRSGNAAETRALRVFVSVMSTGAFEIVSLLPSECNPSAASLSVKAPDIVSLTRFSS